MKKTLALLLCLAMLFTALTVNVFAAENPTVTIVTNSVSEDGATSFAINLAGFESLKGYDLVVEAGKGLILESASALNAKTELAKDVNYTVTEAGDKLHIVELAGEATGEIITVKAKFAEGCNAAVEVKVTADLAKSGTELYTVAEIAPASIAPYVKPVDVEVPAIPEGAETVKIEKDAAGTGYFIPYGSVFTKDGEEAFDYVEKNQDGTFDVAAGTTVQAVKLPEDGFGTFGVSSSTVASKPAKQFGNVATGYKSTNKYGTLIIVGQWSEFRDWNLSNKAYSEDVLIQKIYNGYKKANPEEKFDYVAFTANGYTIKVYNVAQKNYMWKSEELEMLEYAVRVYSLPANRTEYASVAYRTDANGENVELSKEIKSVEYAAPVAE